MAYEEIITESKTAQKDGTELSLVTTGEKAKWNDIVDQHDEFMEMPFYSYKTNNTLNSNKMYCSSSHVYTRPDLIKTKGVFYLQLDKRAEQEDIIKLLNATPTNYEELGVKIVNSTTSNNVYHLNTRFITDSESYYEIISKAYMEDMNGRIRYGPILSHQEEIAAYHNESKIQRDSIANAFLKIGYVSGQKLSSGKLRTIFNAGADFSNSFIDGRYELVSSHFCYCQTNEIAVGTDFKIHSLFYSTLKDYNLTQSSIDVDGKSYGTVKWVDKTADIQQAYTNKSYCNYSAAVAISENSTERQYKVFCGFVSKFRHKISGEEFICTGCVLTDDKRVY